MALEAQTVEHDMLHGANELQMLHSDRSAYNGGISGQTERH